MAQRRKRPRSEPKRRWRDYQTPAGRRPVRDFLASLDDNDAAAVLAAMSDVAKSGLAVAERIDDEIHEVKADGARQTFRVLFASEGKHDQVLLALEGVLEENAEDAAGKDQARQASPARMEGERAPTMTSISDVVYSP